MQKNIIKQFLNNKHNQLIIKRGNKTVTTKRNKPSRGKKQRGENGWATKPAPKRARAKTNWTKHNYKQKNKTLENDTKS